MTLLRVSVVYRCTAARAAGAGSIPAAGRVASSLHCICTAYYRAYFRIGMHECVYMHMYSVYVVYVVPMMHIDTYQGLIGVICSVLLGVLFWPAVQCSMLLTWHCTGATA